MHYSTIVLTGEQLVEKQIVKVELKARCFLSQLMVLSQTEYVSSDNN